MPIMGPLCPITLHTVVTGDTRNTSLLEWTKTKKRTKIENTDTFLSNKKQKKKQYYLGDKRRKLTEASKANKFIYKDRK